MSARECAEVPRVLWGSRAVGPYWAGLGWRGRDRDVFPEPECGWDNFSSLLSDPSTWLSWCWRHRREYTYRPPQGPLRVRVLVGGKP